MEWFKDELDLVFAGTSLSMIVVSVVCALVRWFHVCAPYQHNPSYYYPARPMVTMFFLSQLLYIPVVLHPSDPVTLLYVRPLPLLLMTDFVPLILIRFFKASTSKRSGATTLVGLIPVVMAVILEIIVICGGGTFILSGSRMYMAVAGLVCFVQSCLMLKFMIWLMRRVERYQMDEYSNEGDFPFKFAKKLRVYPMMMVALCWVIFFTGNRILLCCVWLVFCVLAVFYTITILHPQRGVIENAREYGDGVSEDIEPVCQDVALPDIISADTEPIEGDVLSEWVLDEEVRQKVLQYVGEHYLDPHLTRRGLISLFDYGQRTDAGTVISHYGFYEMVNTFRLEHAACYARLHPNETKESVAQASGFRNRFAMRHAEKRIGRGNSDLLEGFTPRL